MSESKSIRRFKLLKAATRPEAPAVTRTDLRASVLGMLNEEDGFMCHDSSWPSNILKELVAEGLADCEVRVGIPTYWRKS